MSGFVFPQALAQGCEHSTPVTGFACQTVCCISQEDATWTQASGL